jgi:alkylhydroperoxidase family enzyme
MPRIETVPYAQATGVLKQQYDDAIEHGGRIWNIVGIMSQNPRVLKAAMDFYRALMHASSPASLSRCQREMIAVVVSSTNHCVY